MPVGANTDIICAADFNLSRKMTLSASFVYYNYYVTTTKEPLHQCQRCAWHVLAAPPRSEARVPSVHHIKSKSDCSATAVLLRFFSLSASLPFFRPPKNTRLMPSFLPTPPTVVVTPAETCCGSDFLLLPGSLCVERNSGPPQVKTDSERSA